MIFESLRTNLEDLGIKLERHIYNEYIVFKATFYDYGDGCIRVMYDLNLHDLIEYKVRSECFDERDEKIKIICNECRENFGDCWINDANMKTYYDDMILLKRLFDYIIKRNSEIVNYLGENSLARICKEISYRDYIERKRKYNVLFLRIEEDIINDIEKLNISDKIKEEVYEILQHMENLRILRNKDTIFEIECYKNKMKKFYLKYFFEDITKK